MFITTLNTGFKLFIVGIHFYGTFEQVSTKVSVVSIISMIKIKVLVYSTDFYTESRVLLGSSTSLLLEIKSFEYEYSEKLYSSVL